ncbi:Uncharacterised protein [Mycobacterium tuberculosis]|nr:Uncharacterised protein [Mycobacterium tuberculosis]
MIARIGIGAATVETTSAGVWVSNPPTSSRASWSTIGRHVSNAPRAIPGASCLRIRVCAGGSDVGRNGSHPREKVTPRALDNVSWLRAASRTSAYRLKM